MDPPLGHRALSYLAPPGEEEGFARVDDARAWRGRYPSFPDVDPLEAELVPWGAGYHSAYTYLEYLDVDATDIPSTYVKTYWAFAQLRHPYTPSDRLGEYRLVTTQGVLTILCGLCTQIRGKVPWGRLSDLSTRKTWIDYVLDSDPNYLEMMRHAGDYRRFRQSRRLDMFCWLVLVPIQRDFVEHGHPELPPIHNLQFHPVNESFCRSPEMLRASRLSIAIQAELALLYEMLHHLTLCAPSDILLTIAYWGHTGGLDS